MMQAIYGTPSMSNHAKFLPALVLHSQKENVASNLCSISNAKHSVWGKV